MLSTTEAKYMVASQAARKVMWLQRLFNEFEFA